MEKGSGMNSKMYSSKTSGRFTTLAFAATLALGFSFAMATDAPAADSPKAAAAQGVVAEKAIQADGGGDCAKAKQDCPKAKADCCKKGAKGSAHHKHGQKGAEANAVPAGSSGSTEKPAGTPVEADKGASHPG